MAQTIEYYYGILAGNEIIENSGDSLIMGFVGAGTSINVPVGTSLRSTGQQLTGSTVSTALGNAQNDYANWSSYSPNQTITTQEIGGSTIVPGITAFTNTGGVTIGSTAGTNQLIFNGQGLYILQVLGGDLVTDTTLASVSFVLENGAQASSIFWTVSGNINLQSSGSNTTTFLGTAVCQGNITFGTNSTGYGSFMAPFSSSNITLNNNSVTSYELQYNADNAQNNYISLISNLSDSEAIQIVVNDAAGVGGISLLSNGGGISLNTYGSIVKRWGVALIENQLPPTALGTISSNVTLTVVQLLPRIITVAASTTGLSLILPDASSFITATNQVTGISGTQVNDSIVCTVINTGSNDITLDLPGDSSGTGFGNFTISANTSATFKIVATDVSSGAETISVYRTA